MTTDELIAEIERLDQAATPGPWSYAKDWFTAHEGNVWCIEDAAGINLVLAKVPVEENTQGNSEDDARLISAYRTLAVEAARELKTLRTDIGIDDVLACNLCGTGKGFLCSRHHPALRRLAGIAADADEGELL